MSLNAFLDLLTSHARNRAGDQNGEACQSLLTRILIRNRAHTSKLPTGEQIITPIAWLMSLCKPVDNRLRNLLAHAINLSDLFFTRVFESLQRAEMTLQIARLRIAHMANRQSRQHSPQLRVTSLLQLLEKLDRVCRRGGRVNNNLTLLILMTLTLVEEGTLAAEAA